MKRHYLTSVTVIAFALGMTAAGAQNVDQRRNTDQGSQTDQMERNQQPQTSGQSQNMPSQQQRSDQDNRQGPQNQQGGQLPRQDDRQPEQGLNQGVRQQQNAPPQQGAQPQQGQNQPQQGQNQQNQPQQGQNQQNQPQQGQNQPQQGQNQRNQPQQEQNQQQGAQEQRQGGEKQQGAKNEQPDKSGRIALDMREQTRVSDIIRQQRIQPVTNINFSLNVGSSIPSSVRLSRISGELAEIFPDYREFSFFVAKQELVIVDSQSYDIVAFVPISGGGTVGMAPPREETGAGTPAPAPDKKKAVRSTEKKRVTVTEKPRVIKRETVRRRPPQTETDVTVGTSRRDIDEFDRLPSRDRRIGPPVRERFEPDEGLPFPLPLFGSPN